MFGALFNDHTEHQNTISTFDQPLKQRGNSGLSGIKNQGSTCYLNSLIQTLLFTSEFRKNLFQISAEELGYNEENSRNIPIELQLLFARLLHLNQESCTTENLTKSFGWDNSEHFQQHDVQELCRLLFDAITASLKGTSGYDIIKDLFKGSIVNRILCCQCGNETKNAEEFLDLTMSLSNTNSLISGLNNAFDSKELMKENNQYFCLECKSLQNAKKYSKIKFLPGVLTFSLLRFNFDYKKLIRFKENGKFKFPLQLNMKRYLDKGGSGLGDGEWDYELYSVIIHSGSAYGGHYHAYICDFDSIGNPPSDYKFFEENKPINSSEHIGSGDGISIPVPNPSDVIAYIIAKHGGSDVTLTQIGDSFVEECGSSWNKMYRKSHGTMLKFINSKNDVFLFNAKSKTVSLKFTDVSESITKKINGEVEDLQLNEDCDLDNGKNRYKDRVWWDFNDSNIKPVTLKEIEGQFEGRESAYMLFYRRRTTIPPVKPELSSYLKTAIENENTELDKLRLEHKLKQNSITVNFYLPEMFIFEHGLLVLQKNSEPITISVFKDSKMMQLNDLIMEQLQNTFDANKFQAKVEPIKFSIMNILQHGGYHLYEFVDLKSDILIKDTILTHNANIMLWDGISISGTNIKPGPKYEPIKLSVVLNCIAKEGLINSSLYFDCVSYVGLCLDKLLERFGQIFSLTNYKAMKSNSMSQNGKEVNLLSEEEIALSLQEIYCNNPDDLNHLNIEIEFEYEIPEPNFQSADTHEFSIDLSSNISRAIIEKSKSIDGICLYNMRGNMKVCKDVSVEVVKMNLAKMMSLEKYKFKTNNLCVKLQMENILIPVHEKKLIGTHQTLVDFKSILLDCGAPLKDKDIPVFLYFSKGISLKRNFNKQSRNIFNIQSNKTIMQNIENIICNLNFDKTKNFYLRYIINEKDIGEVIDSKSQVSSTKISYLCTLLLCEGIVVTEGNIQIPVWHFPCKPLLNESIVKNSSAQDANAASPTFVQYIEISKSSTLYDIKEALMELEKFNECKRDDLCIRNVQNKICTKVYKNDSISIKRMRFAPTVPLAVQIRENAISENDTILTLFYHIPGTRNYEHTHDFIWKNNETRSFNSVISDLFGEDVTIARFMPATNDWKIMKDELATSKRQHQKTNKSKKGGKSKGTKSANKHYDFEDGDIIAVKINSKEANFENGPVLLDFNREVDIEACRSSRTTTRNSAIEINNKPSEENYKTEAILKIHVPNFE